MKRFRYVLLGLLLVCCFFSLTLEAAPIKLEYWTIFTGPDGQTMQRLVDRFNQEYKGKIEVQMSVMPAGNFYEKIISAVVSNQAPDFCIMHVDRLAEFTSRGILLPLDEYVEALGLKGSDYAEPLWNGGIWQGKRYAIPLDTHPLVMYWNKKLFREAGLDPEKPPTDAESFIKVCKALTKDKNGDGKIDQWGTMLSVGWPNFQYWYTIFHQNGGTLFNADNSQALFNSKAGVDALQFLVDCIYVHKISPDNVQVDSEHEAFKRGELGITFNGIWMMADYLNQPNLEFGAGPVPQFGSQKAVWGGSHQFVLPKQRRVDRNRINAAIEFIKWFGDHSLDWGFGGQLPAKLSVLNSSEFRQDPYFGCIAEMADYVYFPPFFAKYGEAVGPIWDAVNAALLRKSTPKEALDRAKDLSNKILAGN
ncbi:MAG TPA: ABC transporter substrate-binding protein [Firmicutes bacterium]|nr:ABC transporter substrate-binding protein [Bacillota bacterium]